MADLPEPGGPVTTKTPFVPERNQSAILSRIAVRPVKNQPDSPISRLDADRMKCSRASGLIASSMAS